MDSAGPARSRLAAAPHGQAAAAALTGPLISRPAVSGRPAALTGPPPASSPAALAVRVMTRAGVQISSRSSVLGPAITVTFPDSDFK